MDLAKFIKFLVGHYYQLWDIRFYMARFLLQEICHFGSFNTMKQFL